MTDIYSVLLRVPILGKIVFNKKIRSEGGQKESQTLREFIREKYKVDVGLFSYGACLQPGFNVGGCVRVGRYCSFSDNICYFGANHPLEKAVMSAYFYNKAFSGLSVKDVERKTLTVGNDVWIGHGVSITNGCSSIGNGAVVGAGSVSLSSKLC